MARVNIEEKAFQDPRVRKIARSLKWKPNWVVGTLAAIWRDCTELCAYEMSKEDIDDAADFEGFAQEMINVGLAELADSGKVRIKGTEGRVEWLKNKRDGLKKARKSRWEKNQGVKQITDQISVTDDRSENKTDYRSVIQSKSKSKSKSFNSQGGGLGEDARSLLTLWAEHAKDRSQPKFELHRIPNSLERSMLARWMEIPDRDYWIQVFSKCNVIEINDWKPSFSWIMQNDENHVKVMSGAYGEALTDKESEDIRTQKMREFLAVRGVKI